MIAKSFSHVPLQQITCETEVEISKGENAPLVRDNAAKSEIMAKLFSQVYKHNGGVLPQFASEISESINFYEN